MKPSRWIHAPRPRGFRVHNNNLPKLFPFDMAYHLASEVPQNSQDAARRDASGERVVPTVTYTFATRPAASLEALHLDDVAVHALACNGDGLFAPEGFGGDVRVLLMEDDGVGLTGPFLYDETVAPSSAQKYLYETGTANHGKGGSDNGRHGLGSSTAPLASKFRCSVFSTAREDGERFASGRLSLNTRTVAGQPYMPESSLGREADGVFSPFTGRDADALHKALGFRRDPKAPGLSVAVVEPIDAVNPDTLLASLLAAQFVQVALGSIRFVLRDEDAGTEIVIDQDSIRDVLASDAADRAIRSVKRSKQCYKVLGEVRSLADFVFATVGRGEVPSIRGFGLTADDGSVLSFSDADSEALRASWVAGRPVSFDAEIPVEHRVRGAATGMASVWLAKTPEGVAGWSIKVRDRIVMASQNRGGPNSITVSGGDALSVMLGDCEDASHSKFEASAGEGRGWLQPEDAIRVFGNLAPFAMRVLAGDADKADNMSLARFFPVKRGVAFSQSPLGARDEEEDRPEGDRTEGEALESNEIAAFKVVAVPEDNAVRVTLTKQYEEAIGAFGPADAEIRVLVKGESRKKRLDSSLGFAASGGKASAVGCESYAVDGDRVTVRKAGPGFRLDLTNIDPSRDVVVSIEPLANAIDRNAA